MYCTCIAVLAIFIQLYLLQDGDDIDNKVEEIDENAPYMVHEQLHEQSMPLASLTMNYMNNFTSTVITTLVED